MESVFPPEVLLTVEEGSLPAELHESARSVLTGIGLPHDRSSFFFVDGRFFEEDSRRAFARCSELPYLSGYRNMPDGWENWLVIGGIFDDGVILDPVSGAVYCLPDGEWTAWPLNRNLDSFAYFLYLIESERPHFDFTVSDEIEDSEGTAKSLRDRMMRADPLPFDGTEPAWSEKADLFDAEAPPLPPWDRVLWDVHESVG
ncbi:SUKH-4 family immunity protein [Streptomyces sp. MST-110588]|nr:SUKH-4 family immunity protein [Streptomyces sp. MST-110588]